MPRWPQGGLRPAEKTERDHPGPAASKVPPGTCRQHPGDLAGLAEFIGDPGDVRPA